jgi:antitoxin component of MazEF toxin-antitoxin module
MFRQMLRKVGEDFVVVVPSAEVERLGLREGQTVTVEITPLELDAELPPAIAAAFEEMWAHNEAGLRYLAEH